MPTIGPFSGMSPVEPKNRASPKLKTPPSRDDEPVAVAAGVRGDVEQGGVEIETRGGPEVGRTAEGAGRVRGVRGSGERTRGGSDADECSHDGEDRHHAERPRAARTRRPGPRRGRGRSIHCDLARSPGERGGRRMRVHGIGHWGEPPWRGTRATKGGKHGETRPAQLRRGATSAEAIETDGGTTTVTTGCDRFGTRVCRSAVN